jgi:predicted GNAT superfamily acetyltransferase
VGTIQKPSLAPGEIQVRHCRGLGEYQTCMEIERQVWGGTDLDVVPLPIFVVTAETGGQVLGAFEGPRMLGFTQAVVGVHRGKPYLHSHMTAVLPEFQNRGIGRRLKLFQRQDALERGIELVEWTFDPLEVRNAHFNIERLGAIVRRFLPNCYGITSSPLHSGLPTDRLVAEWWLDSRRVRDRLAGQMPQPGRVAVRIRLPQNIAEVRRSNPSRAIDVQSRLREEFQHWFERGYGVTGFEVVGEEASYVVEQF